MENQLAELIQKGKTFSFQNNSVRNEYGTFSKTSDELLAWIANVDHFIVENYGIDSGPYRMFVSHNKSQLSGSYQSTFERQLSIIKGALAACENINPKQKIKTNSGSSSNSISVLFTNPFYWTSIAIIITGAFTLGFYFGNNRFDKEKIDLTDENYRLKSDTTNLNSIISSKDSTLMRQELTIKFVRDSLMEAKETIQSFSFYIMSLEKNK